MKTISYNEIKAFNISKREAQGAGFTVTYKDERIKACKNCGNETISEFCSLGCYLDYIEE